MEFESRTPETHRYHVQLLNGSSSEHMGRTFGIVRDSCLNESKYFHVTKGLVPDVMHDLLEGCLQYEMKELFPYMINKKIISG